MKKPDGSLHTTTEENATVFRDHFKQLLFCILCRRETVQNTDHPPDDAEIRKVVRNLKERAPGDSGIAPQIWKATVENDFTFSILRTVIFDFWNSGIPPTEWDRTP